MFNSTTTGTLYCDMPPYVEKVNASCVSSNATYVDSDKYYNFILILVKKNLWLKKKLLKGIQFL